MYKVLTIANILAKAILASYKKKKANLYLGKQDAAYKTTVFFF